MDYYRLAWSVGDLYPFRIALIPSPLPPLQRAPGWDCLGIEIMTITPRGCCPLNFVNSEPWKTSSTFNGLAVGFHTVKAEVSAACLLLPWPLQVPLTPYILAAIVHLIARLLSCSQLAMNLHPPALGA